MTIQDDEDAMEDVDEAALERMLAEESDSSGDETDDKDDDIGKSSAHDEKVRNSVFAAAEDFAEMLEDNADVSRFYFRRIISNTLLN